MDDVGRYLLRSLAAFAVICIVIGYFSACGSALLSLTDSEIERIAANSKKGGRVKKLLANEDRIVQTDLAVRAFALMLFAGFTAVYVFSPICAVLKQQFDGAAYYALSAAAALALAGVYGSLFSACAVSAPRHIGQSSRVSENLAQKNLGLFTVYLALFAPLRAVAVPVFKLLLKISGTTDDKEVTEEEILQLLDAANESGGIEEEQAEMISNIFEFSDLTVHDVMTHRTNIAAVEINAPVSEAVRVSVQTGVSRIPVYEDTIDDIRGVIYIKDLLPLILDPAIAGKTAGDHLHKVKFVPESAECGELFRYFTENKKQIAVVIDEYGGTAGLVTMEDLLECIVGSIRDEYDENEAEEIQEITPNTFDILGSADPDEVMELLGHELGEDHDYDTIGGFVTDLLGYIPEEGQTPSVKWNDVTFLVIKAQDNRIVKLRAMKQKEAEDEN